VLWTMLVVGIFFAVRSATHAEGALERATAVSAAASIVVYLVHCYGDMGLGTWTSVFTVAPALAITSQLAVATGGWATATRVPPGPVVVPVVRAQTTLARRGASS
jgi:hypothetical protein